MESPRGFLSFSLFKKIIDEVSEYKDTALVPFFRGESLLHPRCIDMLAYAKKKGVGPIQFTTNATLMTDVIARSLIDLELDFISFSIDSIDPVLYAEIRKGADLNPVLTNIEFFCNLKRKQKLDKPEIQVSVVKTKNTLEGINDFVRFWKTRVNRVRVYDEHSQEGLFGSLHPNKGKSLAEHRQPCMKPFTDLVIYWNGDVALCNHDWDRKNPLGNLNAHRIYDIWQNHGYQTIRDAHCGYGKLEPLCETCDHWKAFYDKKPLIGELHLGKEDITAYAQ